MPKPGQIIVRPARNGEELQAIRRLRYASYLGKGYICPHPSGLMSDEWDMRQGTVHFVAVQGNGVIGAVRLVMDSHLGLPMERVFAAEIAALRSQAAKLAEASALTVADGFCNSSQKLWFSLCRSVWQESKARQVDNLCIAVTPDHLAFYQRLLFEPIGPGKNYMVLNGILAYPLALKVPDAPSRHHSSLNPNNKSFQKRFLE